MKRERGFSEVISCNESTNSKEIYITVKLIPKKNAKAYLYSISKKK